MQRLKARRNPRNPSVPAGAEHTRGLIRRVNHGSTPETEVSHGAQIPAAEAAAQDNSHDMGITRFSFDLSAVRALPHPRAIQMKRRGRAPGDAFEQEAEHIAGQVMGMPGAVQPVNAVTGMPAQTCGSPLHPKALPIRGLNPNSPSPTTSPPTVPPSQGRSLSPAAREFMEPRFGHPFGQVRVHTDDQAAQSADALSARAYTFGRHIVFGASQYAPETIMGRHLLAHELVHVLQQQNVFPRVQRTLNDGHDLNSNRFRGNIELEKAYDDETVIENGDTGLHVTILQQALVDAGFPLVIHGVDGRFGDETEQAVEDFQTSKGLTGPDVDGEVGPITMNLLDQHFLHHAPERAIAANPP